MCDILTFICEQVKPVEHPEGPGIWGRNQQEVQYTAQNSDPTADSAVRLVAVHSMCVCAKAEGQALQERGWNK